MVLIGCLDVTLIEPKSLFEKNFGLRLAFKLKMLPIRFEQFSKCSTVLVDPIEGWGFWEKPKWEEPYIYR